MPLLSWGSGLLGGRHAAGVGGCLGTGGLAGTFQEGLADWNLGGGRGGGPVCLPGTTQTAYQPGLEARVSTTPGPALLSFLAFVTLFVFSLGLPAAPELHTPGRSVFPVMGVWEG